MPRNYESSGGHPRLHPAVAIGDTMAVRDFVPPIAVAAARKLLGRKGNHRQQYPSYAAALAECSDNAYENRDIVQIVLEKTKRLRAATRYPHVNATNAYLWSACCRKPSPVPSASLTSEGLADTTTFWRAAS